MLKSIGLLVIASAACAQDSAISAQRIREHTRYLSTDQMEGRGVGQRGGQLATEYIANQLALAGAKPAGENGTFFQNVPLVGVETQPGSSVSFTGAGKSVGLKWADEFVGVDMTQRPT